MCLPLLLPDCPLLCPPLMAVRLWRWIPTANRRCSEAVSFLASGPWANSLPWFDSPLVQGVSRLRNTDKVQYTQRPGHLGQMALEQKKEVDIRAPATRPCPCRRPSVVTEGYRGSPPLPPTPLRGNSTTWEEPGANLGRTRGEPSVAWGFGFFGDIFVFV